MLHNVKQFDAACRRLEKQGYERTTEQWADIDESKFKTARALHPDGSYALYTKPM